MRIRPFPLFVMGFAHKLFIGRNGSFLGDEEEVYIYGCHLLATQVDMKPIPLSFKLQATLSPVEVLSTFSKLAFSPENNFMHWRTKMLGVHVIILVGWLVWNTECRLYKIRICGFQRWSYISCVLK